METFDFQVQDGVLLRYGDRHPCRRVIIPQGITHIAEKAFSGCRSMREVVFPNTTVPMLRRYLRHESDVDIPSCLGGRPLKTIGKRAFYLCYWMQRVSIPEGVTTIERYAFAACRDLKTVILPEGLTTIDNGAFEHCPLLEEICLPESVTSIGKGAFRGRPLAQQQIREFAQQHHIFYTDQ